MSGAGESRELGLFDATMLVMGGIVGVGIFFTPGTVAGLVPTPSVFLLAWALGGAVAVCGALTFAELGASMPRAGGWFVYLREAFGPLPAFLFAWTILGVVSTGAIAVIAAFCATTLGGLTPWIGPAGTGSHLGASLAIVLGLTAMALFGIRIGATVQSVVMVAKLVAIGALAAAGLTIGLGGSGADGAAPAVAGSVAGPVAGPLLEPVTLGAVLAGLAAAALPVFFSYGGWQNLCYAADRVRDPARVLPRAILFGVGGSVALYLAVNLGFVRAFGLDGLAARGDFAEALAQRALGAAGGDAVNAAMSVSALGVCAVTVLLTPGIYVAMARSGLFFRAWGRLHARTGAPVLALVTQGAIACGYLLWSGQEAWLGPPAEGAMDLDTLTGSVVFAEWIFHALAAAALLRLRARHPDFGPFGGPFVRLAPVGYLVAALAVVVGNLVTTDGLRVAVGVTAVGLGGLAYVAWRPFRPPSA